MSSQPPFVVSTAFGTFSLPRVGRSTVMPPKPRAPAGKSTGHARHRVAKSLREVYQDACTENGVKHQNSAFVKLLPDKPNTPYAHDTIDLTNNYVGDKGVVAVAAVIQQIHQLRHVNLSKNGLRNAGIVALCAVIAKHRSITSIDVSENYISHGAAVALEQLLIENPRITAVYCADTKLDVAERLRLKELAAANAARRAAEPAAGTAAAQA
jgi:hypothetical protein